MEQNKNSDIDLLVEFEKDTENLWDLLHIPVK